MSKPSYGPSSPTSDAFGAFLEGAAKLMLWAGLAATVLAIGFLIYTMSVFAGGASPASPDVAISNIELFHKLLLAGVVALGVGATFLFWGEETLGAFQLVGAALLFFSPLFLPSLVYSGQPPGEVGQRALGAFQSAGMVAGVLAIGVTIVDLLVRVQLRSKQGSKADQLKYGKGLKEERDIKDVFMGKCWQLPFCRKFVRERCPIYHSKRTCWKERVGCMCEEQVIRDAMAGKVIPKDSVAAATFIPYNMKLTMGQKEERCRQCVIYNEHQKHKYKLTLPMTFVFFAGLYILARVPLLSVMDTILQGLDRMIGRATLRPDASGVTSTISTSGIPFQEILLICFLVVAFTYALKLIEFLIFKLKV
jgi:hypothetical protein